MRYAVNKVGGAVNRVDVDGFLKYCAEIPTMRFFADQRVLGKSGT